MELCFKRVKLLLYWLCDILQLLDQSYFQGSQLEFYLRKFD